MGRRERPGASPGVDVRWIDVRKSLRRCASTATLDHSLQVPAPYLDIALGGFLLGLHFDLEHPLLASTGCILLVLQ